jgi:UDP-glucose 4-epimerase
LVQGDIRDHAAVLDAINYCKPKAVLHFAAFSCVGESVSDPRKYYDNNVVGSLSLLKAMMDADCRKLVFSSSCAVYGEPRELPIPETSPLNPVNPYGASKLMVERILTDYARAYPLESIALRYFNASGADPDGELGELRDPETHLIPRAMMAIQGHIGEFAVFGNDYDTPDGTPIRGSCRCPCIGIAATHGPRAWWSLQSRHRSRLLGQGGPGFHRRRNRRAPKRHFNFTSPRGSACPYRRRNSCQN